MNKFLVMIFIVSISLASGQESKNKKMEKIPVDTNRIYPIYLVEQQPKFPGGNDSLNAFISKNYRRTNMQSEYDGIFYVCLEFDQLGKIKSYDILGCTELSLFKNVIEDLIKKMPNWVPGMIKGIAVKFLVRYV